MYSANPCQRQHHVHASPHKAITNDHLFSPQIPYIQKDWHAKCVSVFLYGNKYRSQCSQQRLPLGHQFIDEHLGCQRQGTPTCVRQRATQQESHSPKAPLRACTRRCAASSPMPWRVAFSRTTPHGAPTAMQARKPRKRLRTRKRHKRSSPRWRTKALNTRRTSSSSSPRGCGGVSAAPCNGGTLTGSSAPSTSAATP